MFPGLDRLRDGDSLEARFNAFKIPESNFLVFEANVRTCRDGCQPAYCSGGTGRSEPSFGRKRRDVNNDTIADEDEMSPIIVTDDDTNGSSMILNATGVAEDDQPMDDDDEEEEEEEHVREMIEVPFDHFRSFSSQFYRRKWGRHYPYSRNRSTPKNTI